MANFPIYVLFRVLLALLMLSVILIPVVFAGFILRLLDKAAKARRRPVKIYIVDFFSLLFLMQIPLAIMMQLPNRDRVLSTVVSGVFSLLMALVWWTTIKTVSRAGIVQIADRCWISLLVIPMMYVGSFAIIAIALTIFSNNFSKFQIDLAVIEAVLVALMFLSLVVTRRALQRRETVTEEIPDE
jgi:hypothetical protein